jgi:flagellar biogenesis protein FliO
MNWTIRTIALSLLAGLLSKSICAEPTPGPPDWNDGQSVYLNMAQEAAREKEANTPKAPATNEAAGPGASTERSARYSDHAVTPALHEAAEPAPPATEQKSTSEESTSTERRHLAPPSARIATLHDEHGHHELGASAASRRLAEFGIPTSSLYKIGTGLAIVIGAFFMFAWALRRGGKNAGRGTLPSEVVSVLGRVPLAARQFAELLRVGNKLVLVSLTPSGPKTLTEVTDPAEVDRLLGLCQQSSPFSTTKAFEDVFKQLSSDPAPSGFLGPESLPTSFASPAGAYRAYRGNPARG